MNALTPARQVISRAAAAVTVAALAVLPLLGASSYVVVTLTSILAYALLAMSISLVTGHAGLPTLAHAAYSGVGAYAVALTAKSITGDGLAQLLIAVLAGAGIAALSGWIAVRATKTFFLMLSLAVGELLHVLAVQWRDLTGGSDGLLAGGPFRLLGSGPLLLSGYVYWVALAVFVAFGAMVLVVVNSPFGAVLRGIRDNEPRMRSLGYATSWYKYAAWVLSGAVAGAAGWISMAQLPRLVAPAQLSFHLAGLLLLAVIIGGSSSMWGACLGAATVALMTNVLSQDLNGHGPLVLGLVFMIAVYVLPGGIAGLFSGRGTPPGSGHIADDDRPGEATVTVDAALDAAKPVTP